MESRIELLDEECVLSRAPNLEANKFAMLSVPDTPSTIEEREAFGLFTFLTADQNLSFFFIANEQARRSRSKYCCLRLW